MGADALPFAVGGSSFNPATAILPWRTAHHPLEGCAEGAFGLVAERQGDDGDGIAGVRQPIPGQQHSPPRQVFHG